MFLVALLLRFMGLGWGLPNAHQYFSLHPDEPIILAAAKQINIFQGDFDPGFYNYGSFYLSLLSLVTTGNDAADPSSMAMAHLMGRLISVVAGAALVWLVFELLRRTSGIYGAIAGSLVVTFSPALVMHSRFQTTDMLAAALLMGSIYVATLLLVDDQPEKVLKRVIWAGALCGLAAGTKYTGILGLAGLIGAVALLQSQNRLKLCAVAVVTTLAGFLIGTPGVLLNQQKFLQDFMYEVGHTGQGHGLVFMGTPNGFLYHLGNLFDGMGGLITILGIAGLVVACAQKTKWMVPVVITVVLTYVVLGRAEVKFLRYMIPLMPMVALGAGWLVGLAMKQTNLLQRVLIPLTMLAIAGFGGGGLAAALVNTAWMSAPDSRVQAAAYLRDQAPTATVALMNDPWFYSPTLFPLSAAPRSIPRAIRLADIGSVSSPKILVPEKNWDVDWLAREKPQFVALSSFEVDDVERIAKVLSDPPPEVADALKVLDYLKQNYVLDREFGQAMTDRHDMMYVCPKVTVWKRK